MPGHSQLQERAFCAAFIPAPSGKEQHDCRECLQDSAGTDAFRRTDDFEIIRTDSDDEAFELMRKLATE